MPLFGYPDASPVERMRLLDMEEKASTPLHENADHIRLLYSQHLMSAASATAYGLVGLLMGFVNKVQKEAFNLFLRLNCRVFFLVISELQATQNGRDSILVVAEMVKGADSGRIHETGTTQALLQGLLVIIITCSDTFLDSVTSV